MEAMACGRAVVAMEAGDISSLVENGKTGFVLRRGDDAGLIRCIMRLVANRELCQRMGKAGRIKAEREFDLKSLAQETLNAYRASGWNDGKQAK
jgi:D-inositol-3-phosphate glycosyltransferase